MKKLKVTQSKDQKLFLMSDPHYSHANICGGTTQWVKFPIPYKEWEQKGKHDGQTLTEFCLKNGVRPFSSLSKMNATIVNNINGMVRENDILFCLGDWSFGGKENIPEFRNRIVCKNLHLVYGNHDQHIQDYRNGFQGLFSSTSSYAEVNVDGVMACLFHYKQTIWNKSHRGALHFYGHSHSNAEHCMQGHSMDVGVDNAFKLTGDYRPFSFDELQALLRNREPNLIDHHGTQGREQE
jgi:calcineurin-like phosphoesterase family protein